jgi:hypothetical protein
MGTENPLQSLPVARPGGKAPFPRRAQAFEVQITDPALRQARHQMAFGETRPARIRNGPHIDQKPNPRLFKSVENRRLRRSFISDRGEFHASLLPEHTQQIAPQEPK